MSESTICAMERTEKSNKVRKEGFIPGVVYGKDMNSKSIKFERKELESFLNGHDKNTIISLKIGNEVKQCVLKELQKDRLSGQILNVEFQAVHSNDMIRLKVPIVFHGKEKLLGRQQLLQENISEIEIMGKADIMPELVSIDVGERKSGDKITVKDIQVSPGIRVLGNEDEVLAVITAVKSYDEEASE